MSLARTRIEFLHDLLYEKHIENPENGYCIRGASPPQFHPCPVRRRIVDHLVRIDHVAEDGRASLERGGITCPCGSAPPYLILDP